MNDVEEKMRDAFITIMTKGKKDNTYKFALARYLLEYTQNHTERVIKYEDIARSFLKYYWHQECKFRITHSGQVEKLPRIVTIIRDVFPKKYNSYSFKQVEEKRPKLIERAVADIKKEIFGHAKRKTSLVVPKFQNIPKGNTVVRKRIFYTYSDRYEKITLNPLALEFFNKYHTILMKTVILEWAKFLEKFNHIPRLIAKIERAEKKKKSLKKYCKIFKDFKECFYCSKPLTPDNIEIDHFIPWSYIFEDEAWNLVPSCKECNRKKSDSLPSGRYLKRLIKRNTRHKERLEELKKAIIRLDTNKGWEAEIEYHYKNCKGYGFSVIAMP